MNRIITSREFGSGGRELGKRLSEAMGIASDREIITAIAEKSHLAQSYVQSISEKGAYVYPIHYSRTFSVRPVDAKESYQLCINTSGTVIKNMIPPISCYVNYWFEEALQ